MNINNFIRLIQFALMCIQHNHDIIKHGGRCFKGKILANLDLKNPDIYLHNFMLNVYNSFRI